jgi:hypothetical protein
MDEQVGARLGGLPVAVSLGLGRKRGPLKRQDLAGVSGRELRERHWLTHVPASFAVF